MNKNEVLRPDFYKVVRIGRHREVGDIFCKITYEKGRLSISGVEGPKRNGDCQGSCGQIDMGWDDVHTAGIDFAPGWDAGKVAAFLAYWKQWHLNDMTAGSPAQERYLREHPVSYTYPDSHYDAACRALEAAGLQPDPHLIIKGKPYSYGSAWLYREVHLDALRFLRGLPDADVEPAWV